MRGAIGVHTLPEGPLDSHARAAGKAAVGKRVLVR